MKFCFILSLMEKKNLIKKPSLVFSSNKIINLIVGNGRELSPIFQFNVLIKPNINNQMFHYTWLSFKLLPEDKKDHRFGCFKPFFSKPFSFFPTDSSNKRPNVPSPTYLKMLFCILKIFKFYNIGFFIFSKSGAQEYRQVSSGAFEYCDISAT